MADDALTQTDADVLLHMEKVPASSDRQIANAVQDALRSYEITPIAWSKREEFREQLAA